MFYKKKIDEYSEEVFGKISSKEKELQLFEKKLLHISNELKNRSKELSKREQLFNLCLKDYQTKGSVVAKMYSDAFLASDERMVDELNWKKHPARSLATEIKQHYAYQLRELRYKLKQYEYQLEEYYSFYPELEEEQDIVDDFSEFDNEPEKKYLSLDEYLNLSPCDRNQRALNNYLNSNHSKSHIGKMYERYIGYLYESQGFSVYYNGIEKGLRDSGIDLICRKNNKVELVQCKCWSKKSKIYEKYIAQFLGSCTFYKLMDTQKDLFTEYVYTFCSTTQLDDVAIKFAKELGIILRFQQFDKSYPIIKCNINGNSKIYHLPFDQQYDKVIIKLPSECYVKTVAEAEKLGFRRAMRWNGE